METYEFNGEKYNQASRHQKDWGNQLISELSLNGTERILDLGCGDGALTEQLAQLVPNGSVVGIDASTGMIQTARENKEKNLQFVQMDINNIDYENEFDIIFSNAALHWIKNHEILLKKSLRALKASGMLLWNFAGDGNCSNFYDIIKRKIKKDNYKKYFENFEWPWYMPSKDEYITLASKTGFFAIFVTEENADRYFSDADEMIRWLDQPSLVPFMNHIPDQIKDTFRSEVIEEMLQKTLQPDKTCFETFRRIIVRATK